MTAEQLAQAGNAAVPFLGPPQANRFGAIAHLKALGLIGTPVALAAYATDQRPFVRRALQASGAYAVQPPSAAGSAS